MHLFSGRLIARRRRRAARSTTLSYTAAGLPWIDHEWLTQAAFATLFDASGSHRALARASSRVALLTAWLIWLIGGAAQRARRGCAAR